MTVKGTPEIGVLFLTISINQSLEVENNSCHGAFTTDICFIIKMVPNLVERRRQCGVNFFDDMPVLGHSKWLKDQSIQFSSL